MGEAEEDRKALWGWGAGLALAAVAITVAAYNDYDFQAVRQPGPDGPYKFMVTNDSGQRVRYALVVDGYTFCEGELRTGFLSDTDSCKSRGDCSGEQHAYGLVVEYDDGAVRDSGVFPSSACTFLFTVGTFGIEVTEGV